MKDVPGLSGLHKISVREFEFPSERRGPGTEIIRNPKCPYCGGNKFYKVHKTWPKYEWDNEEQEWNEVSEEDNPYGVPGDVDEGILCEDCSAELPEDPKEWKDHAIEHIHPHPNWIPKQSGTKYVSSEEDHHHTWTEDEWYTCDDPEVAMMQHLTNRHKLPPMFLQDLIDLHRKQHPHVLLFDENEEPLN